MAVTRTATKTGKTVSRTVTSASKSKTPASKKDIGRTEDGHYIIVNNRKWRATDPLIPAEELEQLKHYLAIGRSGTRSAKGKGKQESDEAVKLARKKTGLAKLGLGERGKPEWWEDSEEGRRKRWTDALTELRELEG